MCVFVCPFLSVFMHAPKHHYHLATGHDENDKLMMQETDAYDEQLNLGYNAYCVFA